VRGAADAVRDDGRCALAELLTATSATVTDNEKSKQWTGADEETERGVRPTTIWWRSGRANGATIASGRVLVWFCPIRYQ